MLLLSLVCGHAFQFNLDVDWDNSTNYEYTCQSDETTIPRHVVSLISSGNGQKLSRDNVKKQEIKLHDIL